jgi:hypothetical protein
VAAYLFHFAAKRVPGMKDQTWTIQNATGLQQNYIVSATRFYAKDFDSRLWITSL